MSYLLTNASALTALQNLTNTQNSLSTTQQQLSSGLKVANASDNSSYWSISQTLSSDNGALGAVNSVARRQRLAGLHQYIGADPGDFRRQQYQELNSSPPRPPAPISAIGTTIAATRRH